MPIQFQVQIQLSNLTNVSLLQATLGVQHVGPQKGKKNASIMFFCCLNRPASRQLKMDTLTSA